MKMMQFSFSIYHVPGKELTTSDAPSQAPTMTNNSRDDLIQEELEAYHQIVMQNLPATEKRLEEIWVHQEQENVCRIVRNFCLQGWPKKNRTLRFR